MIKKAFALMSCLLLTACPNPNDTTQEFPINYIKMKIGDKAESTVISSNQINYTNVYSSIETPVIATNKNGDSVIVWTDNKNGTKDIFARRIDSSGIPKGDIFQVNTTNGNDQYLPNVAINDNGEFVVVWTTNGQDGDRMGVYARKYDANGSYQGNEFKVNTSTTGDQWIPKVAITSNGGFVVIWQSYGQDGNGYAIVGQRFTNRSVNIGYEFIVNNMARGSQEFPDLSMDSQGNFIVVWTTNQNQIVGNLPANNNYRDVYAKKFNRDAIPLGQEFAISTTVGEQYYPSVYMNNLNNYLVAWNTKEPNSGYHDIYARYVNDSAQSKPAFRVSLNNRPDPLSEPAIAVDSSGNSLIVWHTMTENILGSALYGKKFDKNGNETKAEYKVNSTGSHVIQPSVSIDRSENFSVVWREY